MKTKDTTDRSARRYYPALRGVFGEWVYYCCLMSLTDVAKRLKFAEEIHKNRKLSDMIQRAVKEGRSREISDYLQREKERFFNSLVVAIYGGDPEWHGFGGFRRIASDIDLRDVPDAAENSVGFLSFSGEEHMFAIDGQHRLAGIREALKADGAAIGTDELSLVIVGHQNTKKGMERTRRLFTTLNKTARPVGKGEIIALDENDVMAIVTRHLVEDDPRFLDPRIKFVQADNLPVNAPELTTIGNLYDVLTALFTRVKQVKLFDLRYIRPPDQDLNRYIAIANEFFTNLASRFRPLQRYFGASETEAALIVGKNRTSSGGHILFRPIGLRIYAEMVGEIVKQEGISIADAVTLVSKLPVELSEPPYVDVVWQRNGKMSVGGRVLCRRLLLYMLDREPKPQQLKKRYAQALGKDESSTRLPSQVV